MPKREEVEEAPTRFPVSGPARDEVVAEVRRAINQQCLGAMDLVADLQNDLRRGHDVSVQRLQSVHDAIARIAGLDPQPTRVPEVETAAQARARR